MVEAVVACAGYAIVIGIQRFRVVEMKGRRIAKVLACRSAAVANHAV